MGSSFLARCARNLLLTVLVTALQGVIWLSDAGADDDAAWRGTVSFHWKTDVANAAAGTTNSADWSGTWTIKSQPVPRRVGPTLVRVPAELVLTGTSIDTQVFDCGPEFPGGKQVHATTTTAVAALTDELSISTPTPNDAYVSWDPNGKRMRGKRQTVDTQCKRLSRSLLKFGDGPCRSCDSFSIA